MHVPITTVWCVKIYCNFDNYSQLTDHFSSIHLILDTWRLSFQHIFSPSTEEWLKQSGSAALLSSMMCSRPDRNTCCTTSCCVNLCSIPHTLTGNCLCGKDARCDALDGGPPSEWGDEGTYRPSSTIVRIRGRLKISTSSQKRRILLLSKQKK